MMIRKTSYKKRKGYTYKYVLPGKYGGYIKHKTVLQPGKDGVTEEWIRKLHSFDDKEVYNNCKNGHPPLTPMEKKYKKEWERVHPEEKYPMSWNYSIDYIKSESDDGDISKSSVLSSASYDPFDEDVSDQVLKLREIMETKMTPNQRTVLKLIEYEGYKGNEVSKMMGISTGRVSQLYNKAIEIIKKNF